MTVTPSPKTAIPHSRSITQNRPTCAQHWQRGYSDLFGFDIFFAISSSRYSFVRIHGPHLPKPVRDYQFSNILNCESRNHYIVRFFATVLTVHLPLATLGATVPTKTVICALRFFTHKCTRSRIVPVCFCNLLFPPANCYCWLCGWHDSKIDHGRSSGTRKASEACKLTFVEHVPRLKIQPDGKPLIHSRSCDGLKSTEGVL